MDQQHEWNGSQVCLSQASKTKEPFLVFACGRCFAFCQLCANLHREDFCLVSLSHSEFLNHTFQKFVMPCKTKVIILLLASSENVVLILYIPQQSFKIITRTKSHLLFVCLFCSPHVTNKSRYTHTHTQSHALLQLLWSFAPTWPQWTVALHTQVARVTELQEHGMLAACTFSKLCSVCK